MPRHYGNAGIVKVGGTAVGDVVEWDLDVQAADVDLSALTDAWDVGKAGSKSWTGNVTCRFNVDDVQQELLQAGAELALELYSDGDASGKDYFSGTAYITGMSIGSVSRNTAVDKKAAFKGTGALTQPTVV